MANFQRRILVTGGAGFIGSNFLALHLKKQPEDQFICLDALTYAGNMANLGGCSGKTNFQFIHGDIRDGALLQTIFEKYDITHVINFAAESHVDRSIVAPLSFVETNVLGTVTLLVAAKAHWLKQTGGGQGNLFLQVSTDEVYGSLDSDEIPFSESHPYDPHSPYSASKAAADHFVRAYRDTYGLPIAISNCSNNYGPYQFPEKLVPLVINNIVKRQPIPIYGDGQQIRDWLYVQDHVEALFTILQESKAAGETYNIGGENEKTNLELVHLLIELTDKALGRESGESLDLIRYVTDRPGHDRRYAIDARKIRHDLDWEPRYSFQEGIQKTVDWYLKHRKWCEDVISGEYQDYYRQTYAERL